MPEHLAHADAPQAAAAVVSDTVTVDDARSPTCTRPADRDETVVFVHSNPARPTTGNALHETVPLVHVDVLTVPHVAPVRRAVVRRCRHGFVDVVLRPFVHDAQVPRPY